MWYDILIDFIIIVSLIVIVASRVTKQSIPDMLGGIGEWMSNRKEEAEDKYMEVYG